MGKSSRPTEFDLLELFATEMEREGIDHRLVRMNIDAAVADQLSKALSSTVSVEEVQRLADRCLANEWIEHTAIGVGKYGWLVLTSTGIGIVRSRQRKKEALDARSGMKKLSDYIEDHKGLFVALGALLTIVGLLASYWR